MRKIFPENNYTELVGKDSDIVKREDILPITEQLNQTIQALEVLASQFEDYKDDQQTSINTSALNAVTAAITTLNATLANLESAEVDNLTVDSLAQLTTLTAQIATITTSLSAAQIETNLLETDEMTAQSGTFNNLFATSASIDSWNVSNFNITNLTISNKITTPDLEATSGSIGTLTSNEITVDGDIDAENITAEEITAEGLSIDEVAIDNIAWKGEIALSNVESFYLEIPHFENGQYYLQLLDNTTPFATIEIFNSVDNYFVRWSQSTIGNIQNIFKQGTGTASQIYIEFENESGNALTLKYGTTCITPNVAGPESYSTQPVDEWDIIYPLTYKDGSKFFKNVDLATQGSTVGILRILATDTHSSASSDSSYDTTEDVEVNIYLPDQSLNEDDDVKFNKVDTKFINARDFATRNFTATELETESTIDPTDFDDGSILIFRYNNTGTSNYPSNAYIKQTVNNSAVLYPIASVSGTPGNAPLVWDTTLKALKGANDISITGDISCNDITGTGDLTIGGDATITGDISGSDLTLSGDANITGDISANDAEFDSLNVAGTTTIHGDLYVDGVTHTTKEESISTTGDVVVLRQNNSTSLGATYAGMLINKYNGTSDLALVTDSDGTLRVGTGTGADTIYQNLYWDNVSEKWYSDSALTTEVSPTGTLTSWDSLETIGDVLHYTNAVFTVINFNGLVPLLARDESTNLTDQSLLKWDASTSTAKTITLPSTDGALLKWNNTNKVFEAIPNPTADGQVLVNKVVSNVNTYDWEVPAGTFVFNTMADYTAAASSVPNGSSVIILGENNYLIGE